MKKLIFTSILALLVAAGTTLKAQDRPEEYLGLPGDNLNLYAVMNLFQQSETLEGFEKALNAEDSRINNLDLNGDNMVDYIMVSDFVDDNVHNIVLQVAISPNEKQDVAVFTVEKLRDGSAQVQLIGDEALYGKNYIIEPNYADNSNGTPNPGYRGRRNNVNVVTYYEVASWPMIRFIYNPYYTGWHSNWYWGYYPSYWHTWSPFYYDYYYGYHHNLFPVYYSHYRHWDRPRYSRYNDFYYSRHRSYSNQVNYGIREGRYKSTYSRPEQRRDGEALYAKTHSNRSSNFGTSNRNSNYGTSRRSGNNRVNTSSDRSNTTRRSSGTVNESTNRSSSPTERVNRNSSGNTTRRSESTVNNRSNRTQDAGSTTRSSSSRKSTPAAEKKDNKSRRSTGTVKERTQTDRTSGPNAGNYGRSSSTVVTSRSSGVNRNSGSSARINESSHGRSSSTAVSRGSSVSRPSSANRQSPGTTRQSTTASPSRQKSSSSGSTTKKSSGSGDSESRSSRR